MTSLKQNKCYLKMGYPDCSQKVRFANICSYCAGSMNITEFDKVGYGSKNDPNCIICHRNSDLVLGQKIFCNKHYNEFK